MLISFSENEVRDWFFIFSWVSDTKERIDIISGGARDPEFLSYIFCENFLKSTWNKKKNWFEDGGKCIPDCTNAANCDFCVELWITLCLNEKSLSLDKKMSTVYNGIQRHHSPDKFKLYTHRVDNGNFRPLKYHCRVNISICCRSVNEP